jgi:hypothetical protein
MRTERIQIKNSYLILPCKGLEINKSLELAPRFRLHRLKIGRKWPKLGVVTDKVSLVANIERISKK